MDNCFSKLLWVSDEWFRVESGKLNLMDDFSGEWENKSVDGNEQKKTEEWLDSDVDGIIFGCVQLTS